ncbi:MAG: hypothetical protein J6B98_02150, partial [Bacilli bacterium]|nr:hypothetical protein [Bacilli bacterium]
GVYVPIEKVVLIDVTHFAVNKKYGVHEMGHAYLDGRNERKITFNGSDITYGIGLEEGAMSILEVTSNIQDINKRNCTSYPLQAKLFHQLNALYGYSNVKEYKNLLLHLFVEPEKFIPLIRDIYDDIYKEQLSDFKHILSDKSALAMVSGTDSLIDYDAGNLNGYLNYLNSLYLNVADEDVRNERYFDNMFISAKDFLRTNDEVLYFNIFGNDKLYYERQQRHLETLLGLINEELEKISIQTDNDRNKVFVRR